MVGSTPLIRVSSVMLFRSSSGTLKSTLISSFFPFMSMSLIFFMNMLLVYICLRHYFKGLRDATA